MPNFDYTTFARATSSGQGLVTAIGTQYGVPNCILSLTSDLIRAIPGPVLVGMRSQLAIGKEAADATLKFISKQIRDAFGIIEFDTDDGTFRFVSSSSKLGQDSSNWLSALLGFTQALASAGSTLYANYELAREQYERLVDCFNSTADTVKFESGNARSDLDPAELDSIIRIESAVYVEEASAAADFAASASAVASLIDTELASRQADPSREPRRNIEDVPREEIFRLEYGPPKSNVGKFILSVDGLYFDSQTSGLVPALLELERRSEEELTPNLLWKLEHDPNLGGKGIPASRESLKEYFNTILDPNILDESSFLRPYYNQDILLQNIIGQKNRRIYDVSGEIEEQISLGSSQAIISNLRQVMLSETARYMDKIAKRKKQIELAVKIPTLYGRTAPYAPGEVPVNDFSYLEGINFLIDIEKQRRISISQSDVRGIVLPITTKYTQQIESSQEIVLDHLLLTGLGRASIIDNAPSSTAPSISVNAKVAEDGLIALYNFLTVKNSAPSSTDFGVFNGTNTGTSYNAQLVGSAAFPLGLGVPYLEGICKLDSINTPNISAVGSYIKLPPRRELQDLMYANEGATFETWVHIPAFSAYDSGIETSSLYRLILANENTGLAVDESPQEDILNLQRDDGLGIVKGLIFGFTRDRRFSLDTIPSNDDSDNPYMDSVLVLAPTQSYDNSSVGFISKRESNCESTSSWHGLTVNVSSTFNGKSLSSCEDEFCHLVVTISPKDSQVKVYLDAVNVATSSYFDVFGTTGKTNKAGSPSVYLDNSFEYNTDNISNLSVEDLRYGPSLDQYFTPWIIGGGFTDGNSNGNFMGGSYGGKSSGLKGHVGGIKIYSKALSSNEVQGNYNVTQNFFKNINVSGF